MDITFSLTTIYVHDFLRPLQGAVWGFGYDLCDIIFSTTSSECKPYVYNFDTQSFLWNNLCV
jgi:hypothetical protein